MILNGSKKIILKLKIKTMLTIFEKHVMIAKCPYPLGAFQLLRLFYGAAPYFLVGLHKLFWFQNEAFYSLFNMPNQACTHDECRAKVCIICFKKNSSMSTIKSDPNNVHLKRIREFFKALEKHTSCVFEKLWKKRNN